MAGGVAQARLMTEAIKKPKKDAGPVCILS
jgi:hypothetical protein